MSKTDDDLRQKLGLLVSRMVAGELEAFCVIYQKYYNKLLRYGNIILPETEVVEDVIQALFVWILENPQKIKKVKNFEVYLFLSLKRNLREHIKRKNRSRAIIHEFSKIDSSNLFQDSIEDQIIREESLEFNKNWVKQKLNELPARQKEIIFLRYYEGLNYEEIAEIISCSNQVIRNYVSRALKRIRHLGNLEKLLSLLFCACWLSSS